jgi:hypothetical protein
MSEVAIGDVGASPSPELVIELGLEEHLAMARDLLVLLPSFLPGGGCSLPVHKEGFRSS